MVKGERQSPKCDGHLRDQHVVPAWACRNFRSVYGIREHSRALESSCRIRLRVSAQVIGVETSSRQRFLFSATRLRTTDIVRPKRVNSAQPPQYTPAISFVLIRSDSTSCSPDERHRRSPCRSGGCLVHFAAIFGGCNRLDLLQDANDGEGIITACTRQCDMNLLDKRLGV